MPPITDDQRSAAHRIAAEYDGPGSVRVTPNAGPDRDRAVIRFPDGGIVVLDAEGQVFADSRGSIFRSDGGALPKRGYDPATDALLVEQPDGELVLLPPWRCAMSAKEHLLPEGRDLLLDELRRWHRNVVRDGSLVVWELLAGETELRRAER